MEREAGHRVHRGGHSSTEGDFSLGIVLCDLARKLGSWDPWKATRVGEASHPGPQGSQKKKGNFCGSRRRSARFSSPHGCFSQIPISVHREDCAITSAEKRKRMCVRRRSQGGPQQSGFSTFSNVAVSYTKHWSDQEIVQRMTNKLSKFSGNESASDSDCSPKQQRSVSFVDNNNFPPLPGRKDRQVDAPKSILKSPGSPVSPQNKGNPKHSPGSSRQLEEWFHRPQSTVSKDSSGPKRKPARFATKINPAEWDGVPVVTSIPQILSCLRNDPWHHGNLVVTADESASDEIKQIWRAYELTQPMSIAPCLNRDLPYLVGGI